MRPKAVMTESRIQWLRAAHAGAAEISRVGFECIKLGWAVVERDANGHVTQNCLLTSEGIRQLVKATTPSPGEVEYMSWISALEHQRMDP